MKRIEGLAALVAQYGDRDEPGWIMVMNRASLNDAAGLIRAHFLVAEDEDEEEEMLDEYVTFLEIPTFQDVLFNERRASRTGIEDIAAASIYYREMDTFRD